jgi:hypothetical protein
MYVCVCVCVCVLWGAGLVWWWAQLLRAAHPQFAEMRNGQPMQQDADECWSEIVNSVHTRTRPATGTEGRSFIDQFFRIEFATTYGAPGRPACLYLRIGPCLCVSVVLPLCVPVPVPKPVPMRL